MFANNQHFKRGGACPGVGACKGRSGVGNHSGHRKLTLKSLTANMDEKNTVTGGDCSELESAEQDVAVL